jgi:hypothetical protein
MIELQLFCTNFEMVLLCRVFRNELKVKGVSDKDIDRQIVTEFHHWFRSHVSIHFFCLVPSLYCVVRTFTQDYSKQNYGCSVQIINNLVSDDNLYALSPELDRRAKTYIACIVGGVWYHTKARVENWKTQNSGILTTGSHKDIKEIEFYGSPRDIIELRHNSGLDRDRTVALF